MNLVGAFWFSFKKLSVRRPNNISWVSDDLCHPSMPIHSIQKPCPHSIAFIYICSALKAFLLSVPHANNRLTYCHSPKDLLRPVHNDSSTYASMTINDKSFKKTFSADDGRRYLLRLKVKPANPTEAHG